MRIFLILILFGAAVAGYIFSNSNNPSIQKLETTIESSKLGDKAKSMVEAVRTPKSPECRKLLKNIEDKTTATVQHISTEGHEVLLDHAPTKSSISLDCSNPARMSLTFISKDTEPAAEWYKVIASASDMLVNKEPAAIIEAVKKCLVAAKSASTTSAEKEISGIDVDCSLPEKDESGLLVAIFPANPKESDAGETEPQRLEVKKDKKQKGHTHK
ncbi:MAG: hypothetical protein ACR2HL_01370 [Methylocystis sp.]|jgi:hypothetical protein